MYTTPLLKKDIFPIDFLNDTLIGTLGSMLPSDKVSGYPYELFILISIGIEFLGACEDLFPWHEERHGRTRFFKGLELLGPKYSQEQKILYEKLRCGMAHIFAPVMGLGIGQDRHGTGHLVSTRVFENGEKDLILNVNTFFADFKKACEEIVKKIQDKDYSQKNKIYQPFLSVPVTNKDK